MRLAKKEINIIVETAKSIFKDRFHLTLFGSRIDDSRAGGDIDLLVTTENSLEEAVPQKIRFLAQLISKLGEQKIDVVLKAKDSKDKLIYDVAQKEGIILC